MTSRLQRVELAVAVSAAAVTASPLLADNVTQVDQKYERQVLELIGPGTLLVWSCPTCSYKAEVLKVRSVKPVTYSPGTLSFRIEKSLVIAARNGVGELEKTACASARAPVSETEGALGEYGVWDLDFTYTYYSPRNDGAFQNVGALFGVHNNPVARMSLSKAVVDKIRKCARTAVDEK